MALKTLGKERIHDGDYIAIDELQLEGGKKWEMVARKGNQQAVAGLLRHTENNSYIFIEQYRYPVQQKVIELVAGLQDKEKLSPAEHLYEEVLEETGYQNIGEMTFLAETSGSAGLTSETALLFDVEISGKRGLQNLEESEDIKVLEVPQEDFVAFMEQKVKQGFLVDPKVYMSVFLSLSKVKNILT